jgi:NADH-quinone oxidoreductase subunit F
MANAKLQSFDDLKQRIERESSRKEGEKQTVLVVSAGTCGQARGSLKVIDALEKAIHARKIGDRVGVKITGCHGFCEAEPNIIIKPHNLFYKNVQPEDAKAIIEETVLKDRVLDRLLYKEPDTGEAKLAGSDIGFYKKQKRIVLGDNELIEPTKIEDYFSIGGYNAIGKVLEKMTPDEVIEEIIKSGLRGRGGAGFPTGKKWTFCRAAKGEKKYIICNADEGDPGAYMDRSLMEGNPHRVLEGMIIGAFAIGADEGYIYIRDEYPVALEHIGIAIEDAKAIGLLGDNILGSGFNFDVHIYRGAGAFVCGEETAMIESIEGGVGIPRQRPPFPATKGLWKKPTNINNVETWGNVPIIINKGSEWYAKIGTEGSKGTKIFSLVGKINNTGLVEVPMGISLQEIIFDIGGGIPKDKKFKAVQTGGPSGGCLPREKLDLLIDYESLTKAGSIMGSGGMIVMDDRTCMVDVAKYFLNFLRDESCGKCISCREGTQRMWEIVTKICNGLGEMKDVALLEELAGAVKDASMCGLGQTAANPVLSTLNYFRNEYEEHIQKKRCSAMVCREIVSAPCQSICPIDQEASVYIALIAQERFEEAFQVIRKDNPLPSVCGRVCDHQCESVCRSGDFGEPIAIRALKRFVMDWAIDSGKNTLPIQKSKRNDTKVAVVGSGPAGLAAAHKLNFLGYDITVFESQDIAGGMLALGIPEHRLPKALLRTDIDFILKSGVQLRTNTTLGKDITIDDLIAQGFKAVFIATGAHKSMKLAIPEETAEGVLPAMHLLPLINTGKDVKLGANVGIIGGGNAAIDAARVAIRHKNTEKVTILYRRTRKEMPAYEEEIEDALAEGIEIQYLVVPIKVLEENGKVTGVECIRMELGEMDQSGRRSPIPISGSEFTLQFDTIIPAIGERPDTSFIHENDDIKLSRWDTIIADEETCATGRKNVFAGGDVTAGPSTIIKAIAAGKRAAEAIDKFLQGKSMAREYKLSRPSQYLPPVQLTEEEIEDAQRAEIPRIRPEERRKNFKEVALTLTKEMAVREARRCLRCELETLDGKNALGQIK